MFKNVAGQKLTVYVFDPATGLPETGDAANLTTYVSKDDGTVTVLADTSATEKDATNAPGYYTFDLAQAETNADKLDFSGKSSTSGLVMVASPPTVYTRPANFSTLAIGGGGLVSADAVAISGDTTAADKLESKLDRYIYVNHDGNDTTSGTTLHNTIEGASAGSVVSIGPGRFYFGTANITIPDDVSVIGSGRGITRLASGEQGALSGARIKPGDRSYLADFTFDGSETLAGGVAYEYPVGYDTDYDDPFVDAIMERVDVYGSTDAVFLSGSSESDACSLKCVNCRIFSVFDIAFAAGANKRLELIDCDIWGDYNGDYGEDRTFLKASNGGLLIARNCRLRDASASGQAIGAHALNSGSKIYVENSRFDLFNTGDLHAEAESSGAIEFAACQYDSAKVSTATSGTFAVAPLATELAAINAAVEAGQVGTDATEMLTRVPDASPGANGGLPTVDANNRIAGIQGTLTTLDALDTAQDAQHSSTQASVGAISTEVDNLGASLLTIDNNVDAILVDTGTTLDGKLNTIDGIVDDILTDTGTTLPATLGTPSTSIAADIAGLSLGANPNVLLTAEIATVTNQTTFTLASGADFNDAYNGQTIVLYDDSNSDFPSVRVISDYVGSTKTVTIDSAPAFTLGTDDSVAIFATAPGTTAPTAETVATAVRSELTTELGRIDAAVSTRLATAGYTVPPDSTAIQAAAAAALGVYDAPTKAELDAAVSPLATSSALATMQGNVTSILEDTGTTLPTAIDGIEASVDLSPVLTAIADLPTNSELATALDALPTAAENATQLLATATSDAGAGTVGRAVHYLVGAFSSSSVFSTNSLQNAPSGEGGVTIPVNQVVVPAARTWLLVQTDDGLRGEESLSMKVGESKVFAIDYRNDLPTNGRLSDVDAIAIETGTGGGVTFASTDNDPGVDKTQAKSTITAVTAGTYEIACDVNYQSGDGGGTAKGVVTLIVTE